jgi:hypothetical protein
MIALAGPYVKSAADSQLSSCFDNSDSVNKKENNQI